MSSLPMYIQIMIIVSRMKAICRSKNINLVKYKKRENGTLTRICPECKSFSAHQSTCTLKINRYKHYSGFYPLWLCEPDKDFHEWYKNVNRESIRFAESLATAGGGIEP
jgi:hypothetical protein